MKISDEDRKELWSRMDGARKHGVNGLLVDFICDLIERASGEGKQQHGYAGRTYPGAPMWTVPTGCVCPPKSEQTCQAPLCPRKAIPSPS